MRLISTRQGQTLSHVGIYLNDPVFTHGQLYIAFFRATNPKNLHLAVPIHSTIPNPATKNVVFAEVLL
jgi:hypothetical protein